MVAFTWKITGLDCTPDTKIVKVAYWECTGSDAINTVSTSSSQLVDFGNGAPTPYEDLTESQVLGWVKAAIDWHAVETAIDAKLQKAAPIIVPLPLPWETV